MAISKAIRFVDLVVTDDTFRKNCYLSPSRSSLLGELGFTEAEFEDALNKRLLECQTEDEAVPFEQLKLWFSML